MHTSLLNDLQEAIVGNNPPVLIFLVIPLAIVIDFYHFRRVITLLLPSVFHLITKESRWQRERESRGNGGERDEREEREGEKRK